LPERDQPPPFSLDLPWAPEIASTPAASELLISGSCGSTAGPLTLALYI
ncbi:hypothetical protein T01_11615, partial [Trichinella spiralis]